MQGVHLGLRWSGPGGLLSPNMAMEVLSSKPTQKFCCILLVSGSMMIEPRLQQASEVSSTDPIAQDQSPHRPKWPKTAPTMLH